MSADFSAGADRRSRSREKLATLVRTRTETLSLYTELARQRPFEADEATREALQDFCQALIDYAASAHFQLYRYIADKLERRAAVLDIAGSVYPRIVQTTDAILRFNDKYENVDVMSCEEPLLQELADDLSLLGETLAERIQLEDKVISAITGQVH
ncbi:MAG TPA: Rsd/AlgQ family anti-sigma factor [Gammaproteobacteria bacterium]|nr:Rsd/AlgQ family anti-sigma factor [Gammaproteobacteria bacterium]